MGTEKKYLYYSDGDSITRRSIIEEDDKFFYLRAYSKDNVGYKEKVLKSSLPYGTALSLQEALQLFNKRQLDEIKRYKKQISDLYAQIKRTEKKMAEMVTKCEDEEKMFEITITLKPVKTDPIVIIKS